MVKVWKGNWKVQIWTLVACRWLICCFIFFGFCLCCACCFKIQNSEFKYVICTPNCTRIDKSKKLEPPKYNKSMIKLKWANKNDLITANKPNFNWNVCICKVNQNSFDFQSTKPEKKKKKTHRIQLIDFDASKIRTSKSVVCLTCLFICRCDWIKNWPYRPYFYARSIHMNVNCVW